MVSLLVDKLIENNMTISIAESMTGGYLSHKITTVSGSSKIFKGSIISYSKESKINLLKVSNNTITKYSIVSKEVCKEMNDGLLNLFKSNIYVSVTGNAGPSLEEGTKKLEAFVEIRINKEVYDYQIKLSENKRIKNIKTVTAFIIRKIINLM